MSAKSNRFTLECVDAALRRKLDRLATEFQVSKAEIFRMGVHEMHRRYIRSTRKGVRAQLRKLAERAGLPLVDPRFGLPKVPQEPFSS